jgi:Trypsin-like peptidase domain
MGTLAKAALAAVLVGATAAAAAERGPLVLVNVIDGTDDRGSILDLGPSLGLSAAEIDRIRSVSGHVGCFDPLPTIASGALFLTNGQVLTAGHVFFTDAGQKESKCFFRRQAPGSEWLPLRLDAAGARFGGSPPKPGSNDDWAIVRLTGPIAGVEPFAVDTTRPAVGDRLIVVSAHPAGMDQAIDPSIPVVQGCRVRRAPISSGATSFYRSDCDASGASSGSMHLARVDGELRFRGITISTGPWRDPALHGAPYDEKRGSVTTALGTDKAILKAGRSLASGE